MSEVYKIADICILPSKSESFGYSALESLSLGIFTILNDIPTFTEIAKDNSNNYIFKNNKDELKIKLLEIIKNERYEKKEIPSDEWQKQYDINIFAKSYLNIIN